MHSYKWLQCVCWSRVVPGAAEGQRWPCLTHPPTSSPRRHVFPIGHFPPSRGTTFETMSSRTTVAVSTDTADRLHDRKDRGESFDDVIQALLERTRSDAAPAQ